MVSDARICIRRAELSDARIRSRKLYRQRWYQTHGRYWTRCRYQTRGGIPRGRYQTRGGIRRAEKRIGCRAVRGRGGEGEEDRYR